jgi:hypothetical protein
MAVQCCTVIILRLATNLFAAFRYFPVFLRWTQQRTITLSSLRLQRSAPCSTPSRSLHPFHLQFFPFKRQRPSSLTWLVNPCGQGTSSLRPTTKVYAHLARALRSIKASTLNLIQRLLNPTSPSDPTTRSAVRRVLATSTDPDNIAAAVALIPTITWSPDSDIVSYCRRIRDTFVDCFEIDGRLRPSAEDRAVTCGRALNHLVLAGVPIGHESNTCTASQLLKIWQEWRSIILPREFDHCKTLARQLPMLLSDYDRQRCQADTRTALRIMIAAAGDGSIHPDNDSTIWRG